MLAAKPRNVVWKVVLAVAGAWCTYLAIASACNHAPSLPPCSPPVATPSGAPAVWVVDDGVRVQSNAGVVPAMSGHGVPIWQPDTPIRIFGLPGETLAFQVVVTAGSEPLIGVQVDLELVRGVAGNPTTLSADRFVVLDLRLSQRSGGKTPRESLGWSAQAMPDNPSTQGRLPDPLIPIDAAPPWADYPMTVPTGLHRVVWFDLFLPINGLAPGAYTSRVQVRDARSAITTIPVELQVGAELLPYAPIKTMVYFDPKEVIDRTGTRKAAEAMFQLLHAHHLSAAIPLASRADIATWSDALSGELVSPRHGYRGPGAGKAIDVVALGAYGDLGDPTPKTLDEIAAMLAALESLGVRDEPGTTDVFVYATDESCNDGRSAAWRKALRSRPQLRVRVAQTCSDPPASQDTDIAMVFASAYDPIAARQARESNKAVWVYNGFLPQTGAFLTDAWGLSLRANGWIQATHGIDRWFYWESTFWNDDNPGGRGPYDPFAVAETFHNRQGDHCNGDGVLAYPGTQTSAGYLNAGFAGVFPSIRMKQWRRGIQDAGYLLLAKKFDSTTNAIALALLGKVLQDAQGQTLPSWPLEAAPWLEARRKLFDIIARAEPAAKP